jgi:hypothetical protein
MDGVACLARMIIGLGLFASLAATSVHASTTAGLVHQSDPTAIVPFTGTAVRTWTLQDQQVPKAAAAEFTKYEQTETFAVRDATHWRVEVHVTTPVLSSADQTIVSNGQQVIEYSTLSNHAYRFPNGTAGSILLLSGLLQLGAPLGDSPADYVNLLEQNPRVTVRSLGTDQVAGQQADVVQTSPVVWSSTGSCSSAQQCAQKAKGYGSAKVWLDHQYGVVLRYETHGLSKLQGWPQRGLRYVVTSIAFGQGPSDADLAHIPPVAIKNLPGNSGGGGGGGPDAPFTAPPGLIVLPAPVVGGTAMTQQSFAYSSGVPSDVTNTAEVSFQGNASQGFVYVMERMRALGLPSALTTGSPQAAGSCQARTGTFADGNRWLAMVRGHIAVLVVANKLSAADLVQYAASGICTAPIVPQPSKADVENTALDRLSTEIDITRQIIGWAIAAAPNAADKQTLTGFDKRLEAFDRTVFSIRHRGDPHATYTPPGFGPPEKESFANALQGIQGELGAADYALTNAETAVQSAADRHTLKVQGKVFNEINNAVGALTKG